MSRRPRSAPSLSVVLTLGLLLTGVELAVIPQAATAATPTAVTAGIASGAAAAPGLAPVTGDAQSEASRAARATGVAQVVDSLTTPTSQTTANPDGTFTLSQSVVPVRVQQGGTWVPVNLTLQVGADGLVRPAAGPSPVTFSGGGSGPLVSSIGPDGRALTVQVQYPTALTTLPAPSLDGPTATYADVLPDVDLVVSATATGGFSEVFRVTSADAATNPALRDVTLEVTTPGMTMSVDPTTNTLAATDTTGQLQFHAPTPTMWDSTTPRTVTAPDPDNAPPISSDPAQSDATGPGVQADTASMPTTVTPAPAGAPASSQTVHVHPDLSMLSDPSTVYPVYIDPYYAPYTDGRLHFTWVQQGCPDTSNYDSTARSPGAGLNGYSGCVGIERSFFQMDTSPIAGATIGSASLQASVNYSAQYCPGTAWVFAAYLSHGIGATTTWNNQPATYSQYAGSFRSVSHCQGQGAVPVSFDVTSAIQDAAAASWSSATFRVGGNESDQLGWKRLDNNPVLNVTYDWPPKTPTNLSTTPSPANGYLGRGNAATGLTLRATVATIVPSQDVRGVFTLTDTTANKVVYTGVTGYVTQSGTVSVQTPSSVLVDGHTLAWKVWANDGILNGPTANASPVTLDTTPPDIPTVTSTDFPSDGSIATPAKTAGQTGAITMTVSDGGTAPSGIARIDWQLNGTFSAGSPPATTTTSGSLTASGAPASVTINPTPTDWGTNTLRVRAIDKAGNTSQDAIYYFYVRAAPVLNPTTNDLGPITGNKDLHGEADLATIQPGTGAENGCSILQVDPISGSDPSVTASTSTTVSPYEAAGCTQAPDGTSWSGALLAHNASFSSPNGLDDMIIWQKNSLYVYRNGAKGTTPGHFLGGTTVASLTHPFIDNDQPLDWGGLTALVAPGYVNNADSFPDLVTIENGRLYFYPGTFTYAFDDGTDITPAGFNDLAHSTLMSPRRPPGFTGTFQPSIWIRNTITGVISQIPSNGSTFDPTKVTTIATGGFPASTFPTATSIGTYHNGIPEIITTNVFGTLARQQLTSITSPGSTYTTVNITTPGFTANATSVENVTTTVASDFVPVTPTRLVDTRQGRPSIDTATTLSTGTRVVYPALGLAGIPSLGVTAVTAVSVNVVALNATQSSWVRIGDNGPGIATSTLAMQANETTSGSAIVALDANGKIPVYLLGPGTSDLIIDVTGYYTSTLPTSPPVTASPAPTVFVPVPFTRACDSRANSGYVPGCGSLTATTTKTLDLSTLAGYPTGATAAAVNITAVSPTTSGSLAAWAADQPMPATSVLNPLAGQNTSTTTTVQIAANGKISLQLSSGTTNIIVDVQGYFLPDTPTAEPTGATRYISVPPTRIMRTDIGLNNNGNTSPLLISDTVDVQVAGATDSVGNIVTPPNVTTRTVCAAVLGIQAFGEAADGYLTARPKGATTMPSSVNFTANTSRANTITLPLSTQGTLQLVNNSPDTTHALIDLTGYYTPVPGGTCA